MDEWDEFHAKPGYMRTKGDAVPGRYGDESRVVHETSILACFDGSGCLKRIHTIGLGLSRHIRSFRWFRFAKSYSDVRWLLLAGT